MVGPNEFTTGVASDNRTMGRGETPGPKSFYSLMMTNNGIDIRHHRRLTEEQSPMALSLIGIRPLNNRLIVGIYDDGESAIMLKGGHKLYTLSDTDFGPLLDRNKTRDKHVGIRPRWAIVLSVPDEAEKDDGIKTGDKVLLEFGEWTRGIPIRFKDGTSSRVWSIPTDKVLGTAGTVEYTEMEKEQITRLYSGWESWEVNEV